MIRVWRVDIAARRVRSSALASVDLDGEEESGPIGMDALKGALDEEV